jgi:hypothetical protein
MDSSSGWQYVGLLIPLVTIIAVFTFVAVATWSDNRRRERESFHRHETYRRILEHDGEGSRAVVEIMREEERRRAHRRREGMKLGGLITLAAGVGVTALLAVLVEPEPVWVAGLLPLLVGGVLALYGYLQRPDDDAAR